MLPMPIYGVTLVCYVSPGAARFHSGRLRSGQSTTHTLTSAKLLARPFSNTIILLYSVCMYVCM